MNNPIGIDDPLMEKPGLHKQKLKTVPQWNLGKEADPDCFSHIFAIGSLANVEDFFNVYI